MGLELGQFKYMALAQKQSLPLEQKIILTQQKLREWYDHWNGMVYLSFSGGKDSTVLKHIIENTSGLTDIPNVFIDTGLEYPELRKFAMESKNVTVIKPEMTFREVLKKYGYPLVSKKVANTVEGAKEGNVRWKMLHNEFINKANGRLSMFNCPKWKYLLDAPFKVSDKCCNVMKKKPALKYDKETGRKPILALMAEESRERTKAYLQTGCNAFDKKKPQSQPMGFWTEQDVLKYLYKYKVPYASVYGDIIQDEKGIYHTTECKRTGCVFCLFGITLEKEPNRFQMLKNTHPKLYEYCMRETDKGGLGIADVLDYIGISH